MRSFLLATVMLMIPGLAAAQSQCAVTKPAEPFINLLTPIDVIGRPVSLLPKVASAHPAPSLGMVDGPTVQALKDNSVPSSGSVPALQEELRGFPVLVHIAGAGANLTDLGASHGLHTVAARNAGEFMVFQVAPDGQVAVAGLMTDLTVDQLKAISGDALTELEAQHGLRSFFLRSGGRFQMFYATPDGERIIPGVMWDAAGQDVTRKTIASIPGVTPTVTVGEGAADAHVTRAVDTSPAGAMASLASTASGTSGRAGSAELWMFVDANCSFSIRAMQALQPYVEAGRVRLHLIPVSILDSEDSGLSTQHALGLVSTSPDQMLTAWETGRYPASPAADATPKLAANMAAAAANQVRGTPTFFWRKPDGSSGRMDGVPNDMGALIAALGS